MMQKICKRIGLTLLFLGWILQGNAQSLEEKFKDPPDTAKPRTWFHAMSGNMSKEGLTKDLEAIADAGLGGIILFNVTHLIPRGEMIFNSAEHIAMIAHAAAECERLDLSFGVHNCDGWQTSGGPWITPEYSMKQVVHREMVVRGGRVNLTLPAPTARAGYYRDIAVLAYPSLKSELEDASTKAVVSCSDPGFNIKLATDGRIDERTRLNGRVDKKAWVQFDYGQAYTLRSLYINLVKAISDRGKTYLLVSDDGMNFREVSELEIKRLGKIENGFDDCFEGITARYFRLETEASFHISEIRLSGTYVISNMLARTSLFKIEDHRMPPLGYPEKEMVIPMKDILDLSSSMDSLGNLKAKLPKGDWTIMRFGFTTTGAKNSPASDEGRGLEADKMNKEAFKLHFEAYVRNVIDASKPLAPNALQYIEIDSYETGGQNWTQTYEQLFLEKYKYNLLQFLPLYAGRYVEDRETSDDVLWDIRNLNADLIVENYFDYFTELCHQEGLISYAEPYSFNGPFNELDASRSIDIPMGEFWMHQRYQTGTAVSGARIYGKEIVSAESFSARAEINWKGHPGSMKLTGDKAWTLGINEFMFHRYAHQANTRVLPGMTMSMFGSHIDRTQTWWEDAGKAWFRYLARGQYMLRQGNPVSDLLVFVGDGSPNSVVSRDAFKPGIPHHINFDCINSDALIHRISSENGKLFLPNGISYHALVLYNTSRMKLSTLRKIHELAGQGVVIIGEKPTEPGGYGLSASDRSEFNELSSTIWSKATTYSSFDWEGIYKEYSLPRDLVISGGDDLTYIHRQAAGLDIYFFYNPDSARRTFDCRFNVRGKIPEFWDPKTGDIRTLAQFELSSGQCRLPVTLEAEGSAFIVFREAAGDLDPVISQSSSTGVKADLSYSESKGVLLSAKENALYAFNFQSGKNQQIVIDDLPAPIPFEGPWKVSFDSPYGFKSTQVFDRLLDWKDHPLDEVKHYSGTAGYEMVFDVNGAEQASGHKWRLDLGDLSVAVRVLLNGKDLGVLWKAPFVLDVTESLQSGENTLRLEVTNLWTNRLIGDENYPDHSGYSLDKEHMPQWYVLNQAPPESKRNTFTAYPFYKADDPLLSSGLLGPVRLIPSKTIRLNE